MNMNRDENQKINKLTSPKKKKKERLLKDDAVNMVYECKRNKVKNWGDFEM